MSRDAEGLEIILVRRHAALREAEEMRELRELRDKLRRAAKWKPDARYKEAAP